MPQINSNLMLLRLETQNHVEVQCQPVGELQLHYSPYLGAGRSFNLGLRYPAKGLKSSALGQYFLACAIQCWHF